jgi:hypothetical protein
MNSTLRQVMRADDPALAFLTKSRGDASGPRKPEYRGPAPAPNRFGIKPGYRWDGVDRGNGFEKKRFASINKRKTDAEVEQGEFLFALWWATSVRPPDSQGAKRERERAALGKER